jgi:hypothetical protein
MGFCKLKLLPMSMVMRDSVESKHSAYAITFFYMFVFTIIVVFCVYIENVSKNAIYFLHYTNGISLVCVIIYFSISVDSPLKNVRDGNQELAKKSLNFISWFNSKFTRTEVYQFDRNI